MAQPKRSRKAVVADLPRQDIEKPKQIALLAAPARQELIDTLESLGGEASVAALATHLGRPADGLYYHLRLLVRGGLLEELPDEGEGRRYRTRTAEGHRLRLKYAPGSNAKTAAVGRVTASMLRIAGRDFDAALARPDTVTEGEWRELWASRSKGWLGPDELAEVNRLLGRVLELMHRPKGGDTDQLMSLAWVLSPLAAKPKRRGS